MKVSFAILLLLISFMSVSNAEEWPEGYIVYEKSISPDKRFGILIPSQRKVEADENAGEVNYLVNLKTHRLLGKLEGARYWEKGNHVWLKVRWNRDSLACLPIYDARFGFYSVSSLVINADGTGFRQLDLGKKIQGDMDRVILGKSAGTAVWCPTVLGAQIGGDKIVFRALGTTNPKESEDVESFYASFYGIYDLRSEKWGDVETTSPDQSQFEALDTALLNLSGESIEQSLEAEARDLDESLNQVYQAVRFSLTPRQFTLLRIQQIDWLRKRDSIQVLSEKNRFVEARIEVLKKSAGERRR